MKMDLFITKEITEEIFNEIAYFDTWEYSSEYRSDYHDVQKRFKRNEDCLIIVCDRTLEKTKLVGYIWYFPISKDLAFDIESGNYLDDSNIDPKYVLKWEDNPENVYFSSIVVSKAYRGTQAAKLLMDEFERSMNDKAIKYNVKQVLAIVITEKGYSCLSKSSFETIYKVNTGQIIVKKTTK